MDQPIGAALPDWRPPPYPATAALTGRYCELVGLDAAAHTAPLYAAFQEDAKGSDWTYLPYGPFATEADFEQWTRWAAGSSDPLFFAIRDERGHVSGVASYLRIHPDVGTVEVGHIHFAPRMQRTRAATEAMVLMMRHAFELGYRRYEWKCDALNAPSRRAALRLGFTFEGVFRQATIYKGRNRDTAWYAVIDAEWPRLRDRFESWLDPANFDDRGRQVRALGA